MSRYTYTLELPLTKVQAGLVKQICEEKKLNRRALSNRLVASLLTK